MMDGLNIDWQGLLDETIDDLKSTGGSLLQKAQGEDVETVAGILRRIGEAHTEILLGADADRAAQLAQSIGHNHNALLNLAAKYDAIAHREIRGFIDRLLSRALAVLQKIALGGLPL